MKFNNILFFKALLSNILGLPFDIYTTGVFVLFTKLVLCLISVFRKAATSSLTTQLDKLIKQNLHYLNMTNFYSITFVSVHVH